IMHPSTNIIRYGKCFSYLAGCVVRIENPHPLATEDEPNVPAPMQRGVAGEITASRKVRVLDVPLEEEMRLTRDGTPPPEHSANALYLEWFSQEIGRASCRERGTVCVGGGC